MKRFVTIFLVLILITATTACTNMQKQGRAVQFYYPTEKVKHGTEQGVIASETRYFNEEEALLNIISMYIQGPVSEDLRSPFPADLTVKELIRSSASIKMILSDHIAEQSGINLTLTCACIQKTLNGITGVDAVQIAAENEKINNQDMLILNSNNIFLIDSVISNPAPSKDPA